MARRKNRRWNQKSEFYHDPKEVSMAQIQNQLTLQYGLDFDDDKNLKSNKLIKKELAWDGAVPEKITRSMTNISAAHYELFAFTSYVCTVCPDAIKKDNDPDEPYHRINGIPWEGFCNTVGVNDRESRNILMTELRRVNGQSKIIDLGDRYGMLPPFQVTFFTRDKKEMSAQDFQRLESLGTFPVENINIQFLKVLYDRFLETGNNYINYPKGWPQIVRDYCKKHDIQGTTPGIILDCFTYMNVFDNSPAKRTGINLIEMLSYAVPHALQIKKGKWYLRNIETGVILMATIEAIQGLIQENKKNLNFQSLIPIVPKEVLSLPQPLKNLTILKIILNNKGRIPVDIERNPALLPDGQK